MISQSHDFLSYHSESDLIPPTEKEFNFICNSLERFPKFNDEHCIDVDMNLEVTKQAN